MRKLMTGNDAKCLADARAHYELALKGLSAVRGDELVADLKFGVCAANSAAELAAAVEDVELLVARMKRSLTMMRILESQYGAPNKELAVPEQMQFLAFARVSREWEVTDSGRVSL